MHRHQFDRRDAQRLQIGNLLDDALVRAGVLDLAARRLREAADVGLIDDRLRQVAAEVAIALPIELVVDHHAFGRTQDAALGRQEISRQGLAIRVDQAGLGVEAVSPQRFMGTVRLEVIKLPRAGSRNEHAPDMAPAVQIGIELDNVRRLGVVDAVVEQNTHGGRTAAEDDELHPSIVHNSTIRKGVRELQRRLPLRHGRRLNGATRVKRNIRSIARIGIKRHLFSPIAESGEVGGRPGPAHRAGHRAPHISTTSDTLPRKMKFAAGGVTPSLIGSLPGSRFKWQSRPDGWLPKTPTRSPMAGCGSAGKGDRNSGTGNATGTTDRRWQMRGGVGRCIGWQRKVRSLLTCRLAMPVTCVPAHRRLGARDHGLFRIEHGVAIVARLVQLFHRGLCAGFVAGMGLGGQINRRSPHLSGKLGPLLALGGLLRVGDVKLGVLRNQGHRGRVGRDLAGPLLEVAETVLQLGIDCGHFILHQSLELGHLAPLQFAAAARLAIDGRLEILNGLLRRGEVFRRGQFPGGGGNRFGVRLQRAILIVQAQGDGDQRDRVAVADESALDLALVFLFVGDGLFQIGDQDLQFRGQIVGRGECREFWRGVIVACGGWSTTGAASLLDFRACGILSHGVPRHVTSMQRADEKQRPLPIRAMRCKRLMRTLHPG